MTDNRSELAIERDHWFASEEGKKCMGTTGLGLHPKNLKYLRNRLERAFLAGAAANEKTKQIICDKLLGAAGKEADNEA